MACPLIIFAYRDVDYTSIVISLIIFAYRDGGYTNVGISVDCPGAEKCCVDAQSLSENAVFAGEV